MKFDISLIKFENLEQGSDAWLEFRKGKLGSSSAASIMGCGFKTPLQLFEYMMEDKKTHVNAAMMRGTEMEPIARQWLNDKYKCDLQPVVVSHPNPEFSWHISSIDGFCVMSDGTPFACEIKCPGQGDHKLALDGKVPEKYLPQLYHILEDLPGVDKILYFSYHPDSQAEIWIDRNELEMRKQFEKELSFYCKLLNCTPPEPSDKDWVEFIHPEFKYMAEKYETLQKMIVDLEEELKDVKQKIIEQVEDHCRSKIGNLKIQKVQRVGAIDYSKIEALQGLDLEPYRKPNITSWRISS